METSSGGVYGDQITGARDYQEDRFQIIELSGDECAGPLLILADGMGGHAGGDHASELAVSAFAERFRQAGDEYGDIAWRLRASLDAANAKIGEEAEREPRYADMGCTLLACLIAGDELHWVSVGDSPLWLLSGDALSRINEDHSMRPLLEELVEQGRMTAEEVAHDYRINQLRSAVVGRELPMVDENKRALCAGDWVVLASDGLETLTVEEIHAICREQGEPEKAVATLLAAIEERQRPRQDNTTVVVYGHTGAAAPCDQKPDGIVRRFFDKKR